MSQSIEEEETLRRHARAELLANLPGIERELELLEDAGLAKGAILPFFVGAVAEYLHGEEALELELVKERAAIGVVTWQRAGAGSGPRTLVDLCPAHAAADEALSHVVRGRHEGPCAACVEGVAR